MQYNITSYSPTGRCLIIAVNRQIVIIFSKRREVVLPLFGWGEMSGGGGFCWFTLEWRITNRCGDWRRRCFRRIEKSDDPERCTLLLLLLSYILCIYASMTSGTPLHMHIL